MKKFFSDFKAFITRGNIIDLAVAVIIGGAFGKIVTSLVNDIIMPLISLAVGGASVADWKWVITPAVIDAATGAILTAESALHYGSFLQAIIDFLVISFFIFLALKLIMQAQKGLSELGSELSVSGKKDYKELRKQGNTRKQALAILEERQKAADAAKKAEDDAKAEQAKKNTPEALLAEIRDLLKEKNQQE